MEFAASITPQPGPAHGGDGVARPLGAMADGSAVSPAVSIVMPCLNEVQSLAHCIANATEALARIARVHGLGGEVIIADNGSTDGSQDLARSLGARVVDVPAKGYGAALIGGFGAAHGRFLVMGDADGSYDFTDAVPMIGRLVGGADLCMGSRFKGGIKPGAMPWKNRYIGNPALTGLLNLFFRTGVDDAHCGLRAIRREAYHGLALESTGMEFASEMVIKASLKRLRIDEVPATLSPDLRDRAPHLRPWRDGWRHLRYLFMLSPTWAFGVPAMLAMLAAILILANASLHGLGLVRGGGSFGASWTIVAGFLLTLGHFAAIAALTTHLHGVRLGYRPVRPMVARIAHRLTLENAVIAGLGLMFAAGIGFAVIGVNWAQGGFVAPPSVLPVVLAGATGAIGVQTVLGGLVLAIVAGHDARFVPSAAAEASLAEASFAQASLAIRAPVSAGSLWSGARAPERQHGVLRLSRYTLVSAVCLAIQNMVLISSDYTGLHYELAVLLSTAILLPVGFLLQSHVTFAAARSWAAFARYGAAMASNLPLSMGLAWLLCGALGWPMLYASPTISLCLFGWNYLSSSWALGPRAAMAS
jgi:glycosyltransferase involved in cell wall biosynthesis/putative flippase GtrA